MGTLCNKENTEVTLVHSMRVCGPLPSCFDTLLCAKLASVCLEDEPTGQKSCIFLYLPERKWKAYGTRCSQAVPHPSTILARRCLTSVIRRERVCSSWYGRRRSTTKCNQSHHGITVIEQATSPTWCEPNFLDRSELMSTDKKYQTSYSHWY